MPDPFKCYKFTDAEMISAMTQGWKIPTKWLLSQALDCYLQEIEEIVFSVVGEKLFMRGIRQTDEEGQFLPMETWIEEFPPWP